MKVIITERNEIIKHYENERERLLQLSFNTLKAIERTYKAEVTALAKFDTDGTIEVDKIGQLWTLRR